MGNFAEIAENVNGLRKCHGMAVASVVSKLLFGAFSFLPNKAGMFV